MYFDKIESAFFDSPAQNRVKVSAQVHAQLMHQLFSGANNRLQADQDGQPVVVQIPVDVQALLRQTKNEIRTTRAPMLDDLTGIAGRAQRAGSTTLAAEADALAEALLDITDDPALNAAQTLQDMQAAGVAAYRAIAATASAELAVVFKEITGA